MILFSIFNIFEKKCKFFLINFPSNTNQKYSVLRNNKILRDRWENARYIEIIRFYPEYSTVVIYNERTSRWQGTLGRKGSRISPSHLDILVSRRVAGTLKGRQVKVPHRQARKSVFFSSAPCLSLPLSVRSPLFPETGRRSFSRARLLFFGANDREHVARRLASCVALRCVARCSPLRLLSRNIDVNMSEEPRKMLARSKST